MGLSTPRLRTAPLMGHDGVRVSRHRVRFPGHGAHPSHVIVITTFGIGVYFGIVLGSSRAPDRAARSFSLPESSGSRGRRPTFVSPARVSAWRHVATERLPRGSDDLPQPGISAMSTLPAPLVGRAAPRGRNAPPRRARRSAPTQRSATDIASGFATWHTDPLRACGAASRAAAPRW
jgi:hypothetical protein